ncbi:hypothetical protein [Jeotgalicoccus sp. FSL K6-3177]|uniref:hypothetical protein n=1 Tax=Jeotgalicoccus sp. FSL K6-3177 TaxID=2921494 RepID=UPI0030FD90B6
MASGIKKRSGSDYSDGRPGRINYHSEDEYRTITLTVQATAYDMHDIAHLRDSINELFDDELLLREMRIKDVTVEYESPGQRTGELQLEEPEYVNGKQIKVAMVNNSEIDDTTLASTFTIEFETTDLPYFESIYTTLELNDSGYSATAEKYGLVDNIDDEKAKYRFTESNFTVYNAGNVTVEPESMELVVQISKTSTPGTLSLRNLTTGEEFRLTKNLSERHISLRGMNILDGTVNAFRDSNRRLVSLVPGDNQFEITGATFSEVWFSFKYYYK